MAFLLLLLLVGAAAAQDTTMVSGEVRPAAGVDSSRLMIVLEGPGSTPSVLRSTVDSLGHFQLQGAASGSYKLHVVDDRGMELSSQIVSVSPGEPLSIRIPDRPTASVPGTNNVSVASLSHKPNRTAYKASLRAEKMVESHDYENALVELRKAVEADPGWAVAQGNLGAQYARLSRWAEAEPYIREAIRLDPATGLYSSNLALVLARQNKVEEALGYALRAVRLDAANPRSHLVLGCLLADQPQDRVSAVSHLEFAAREIPEAHRILANVYMTSGRQSLAQAELQRYQSSLPH